MKKHVIPLLNSSFIAWVVLVLCSVMICSAKIWLLDHHLCQSLFGISIAAMTVAPILFSAILWIEVLGTNLIKGKIVIDHINWCGTWIRGTWICGTWIFHGFMGAFLYFRFVCAHSEGHVLWSVVGRHVKIAARLRMETETGADDVLVVLGVDDVWIGSK